MAYDTSRLTLVLAPRVGLATIIFFVQIFMLIAADWLYGTAAESIRPVLYAYLIMQAMVLGFFGTRIGVAGGSITSGLFNFSLMFILTASFLWFIPSVMTGSIELFRVALASAVSLHLFVITYTEESVFRLVLPQYLGDLWSNVLFALFHTSVVMLLMSMGVITGLWYYYLVGYFLLGIIWSVVRTRVGVSGSWGSHVAYNLKAVGLLTRFFGGA